MPMRSGNRTIFVQEEIRVSLSAISTALGSNNVQTTIQNRMQQFQTEFQQLG